MITDSEFFSQFEKSKSKRVRGFAFTLNNPRDEDIRLLQATECQYLIYTEEVAPTTGTRHLQGYIYFRNPRDVAGVGRLYPWSSFPAKGAPSENVIYCSKSSDPTFTKGDRPMDSETQANQETELWRRVRLAAQEGRYNDIPCHIYLRYQSSIKRIRKEDGAAPADLEPSATYGIWIYGPPRTGKSHYARNNYQPLYLKDINKWWDGYNGEANVLIDEFAPEHAQFMTQFMKKWVDRWTFSAEFKGGRTVIRPQKIIVTSNYAIDECFSGIDLEAMRSRFEVIHMTDVYNV